MSVDCKVTKWGTTFMRDAGFASMIVQASKGWSHFSDEIKQDFVYAASIEVDGKRLPALLNIGTDNAAEVSACGSIEHTAAAGNTSHSLGHSMLDSESDYKKHFGQDQGELGKIIKIHIRASKCQNVCCIVADFCENFVISLYITCPPVIGHTTVKHLRLEA